jgi:hypothetical protein
MTGESTLRRRPPQHAQRAKLDLCLFFVLYIFLKKRKAHIPYKIQKGPIQNANESFPILFRWPRSLVGRDRPTTPFLIHLPRDENGRNFPRTVPFRFLYFSVRFRICEIPFSYLRK